MTKINYLAMAALFAICSTALADKTAGQTVDDSAIQSQVKAKLIADDIAGGLTINIETRKGVVQLGGWVEKTSEANEAGKIAASVDGVVSVDNQLHVERGNRTMGQSVDDSIITTRVKTAIADADFGAGIKINVDTYNGVVLLTGFVDSGSMKTKAGGLAAKVENVRDVVNGIHVLD